MDNRKYILFHSMMLLIQIIGIMILNWSNCSKDVILLILISWSVLWAFLNWKM